MKELQDLIRDSIADVCGIDTSGLTSTSRLADIGVDSLASAEVLVDLEIRLGRQLPLGTLRRLEHVDTLGELTLLLEDALGAAPPQVRA